MPQAFSTSATDILHRSLEVLCELAHKSRTFVGERGAAIFGYYNLQRCQPAAAPRVLAPDQIFGVGMIGNDADVDQTAAKVKAFGDFRPSQGLPHGRGCLTCQP